MFLVAGVSLVLNDCCTGRSRLPYKKTDRNGISEQATAQVRRKHIRQRYMARLYLILNAAYDSSIGELNKDEYTRRLPGRPKSVVAVCKKPRYTKAQKRKMANRPQVRRFCEVNAEASSILHDAEKRAEWTKRHIAYMREAKRHGLYQYPRLWDYIRHELNKEKTEAEKGAKI